ncbi:hypothetical protein E4U41_000716 [Claviceps citrina]|nr:hypothetical protein E4U41_000716 [Claviceps citrina]
MFVPLLFMALGWVYAACVNFVPAYKAVVDLVADGHVAIVHAGEQQGQQEQHVDKAPSSASESGKPPRDVLTA